MYLGRRRLLTLSFSKYPWLFFGPNWFLSQKNSKPTQVLHEHGHLACTAAGRRKVLQLALWAETSFNPLGQRDCGGGHGTVRLVCPFSTPWGLSSTDTYITISNERTE